MGCAKRMAGCPASCGHRCLVMDYRAERGRQEDAAWEQAKGYDTEYRELAGGLITFRQWITGRAAVAS